MNRDFVQLTWDERLADDCRELIQLAMREDLNLPSGRDLTSAALVDEQPQGRAAMVAREPLVVAGLPAATLTAAAYSGQLQFHPLMEDGRTATAGARLAEIAGPARALLSAERVMLNILGRLCGIATQTQRYVDAVAGTNARIYDTRKTTPAWRHLEKYAVGCGGGRNHRTGLFDAILIKDNHLALRAGEARRAALTPADAVQRARRFVREGHDRTTVLVEIEVDTLEQLETVLPEKPDIVLLDNMPPTLLRQAVALRDEVAPDVELEASGGITIDNVRDIALSGVNRISIGALTHAARWVDIGLDWLD